MFLFSMYLLSMLLVQLGSSVKLAGFLLNMDTINQIVAVVGILLGTQKKYDFGQYKKICFPVPLSNQSFQGRFKIMNTKPGQSEIYSIHIQDQNQPYIDVK